MKKNKFLYIEYSLPYIQLKNPFVRTYLKMTGSGIETKKGLLTLSEQKIKKFLQFKKQSKEAALMLHTDYYFSGWTNYWLITNEKSNSLLFIEKRRPLYCFGESKRVKKKIIKLNEETLNKIFTLSKTNNYFDLKTINTIT